VASLYPDTLLKTPDLNDYEMPIYSIDREQRDGIPELAVAFKQLIKDADKIIISFAEHNGSYTTSFKNIMDWISRIPGDTWESKPYMLMSTSPGRRGGVGVLAGAEQTFGHMGAQVISTFSLPSFNDNFDDSRGIIEDTLNDQLRAALKQFINYEG